jgi:hypothetical protein
VKASPKSEGKPVAKPAPKAEAKPRTLYSSRRRLKPGEPKGGKREE